MTRAVLALAVLFFAALKVEFVMRSTGAPVGLRMPAVVIWVLIIAELAIAVALYTPLRHLAALAAMTIASFGLLVSGYTSTLASKPGCGCLGRLALTPVQHAALSVCIFGLGLFAFRRIASVARGPAE